MAEKLKGIAAYDHFKELGAAMADGAGEDEILAGLAAKGTYERRKAEATASRLAAIREEAERLRLAWLKEGYSSPVFRRGGILDNIDAMMACLSFKVAEAEPTGVKASSDAAIKDTIADDGAVPKCGVDILGRIRRENVKRLGTDPWSSTASRDAVVTLASRADGAVLAKPQLQFKDTTNEEWREYRYWDAQQVYRVYRIESPQKMGYYKGCTTHRVVDAEGLVHIVPAVSQGGCVMVYKPRDPSVPCLG